jgi:DNA-directed RNA polymerase II subunit RPB7
MGFFRRRMTRQVMVHPQHLGANLKAHVRAQCSAEAAAEGVSDAGFVVAVLRIPDEHMRNGPIDHFTGAVRFDVTYDAICFRPMRNEVMDALVQTCTAMGFYAEAGPFTLFVSRIHLPADMEFRPEDTAWVSADAGPPIRAGAVVRVRVMGVNPVSRSIAGIGTINAPFLGVLG